MPGLDPLIEGGFPANRAIVLCGATGTGKTTFGLQFLVAGLESGDAGVFVTVDEKPGHLIADAARLGYDLASKTAAGTLVVLDASPYFTTTQNKHWARSGVDARQVAADLVQQVRNISARRIVIDSLTSLVPHTMDRGQAHDYLRSLIQALEDNLGCTILLTCRATRTHPLDACGATRYLASGVLELHLRRAGKAFTRSLSVRKMRGTAFEPAEYGIALERGAGLSLATVPEGAALSALRATAV